MGGKKLVQFGAGNIGRSFIGQLFSAEGYEVVFIDVNSTVVELLNKRREYRVILKSDSGDSEITVRNVRGVDGRDKTAVAGEIASCSCIATSVGQGALPHVFPVIAAGLRLRAEAAGADTRSPGPGAAAPVDIIIAENIRRGADFFRAGIRQHLPAGYPLDDQAGFVETSIGKMVPIMTESDLAADPLQVFAEPYNTLIVDRAGFRGPLPEIPSLKAVDHIAAYVDRKLFIHNLGHAAAAYLGNRHDRKLIYIREALESPEVLQQVRHVMNEAAAALIAEYPAGFTKTDLSDHIDDLLNRFRNRALGDTIFRVGRDLRRKLGREDRIIGAILLAAKHNLPWNEIGETYRAAVYFQPPDQTAEGTHIPDNQPGSRTFPADQEFRREYFGDAGSSKNALHRILIEVSGLRPDEPVEFEIIRRLTMHVYSNAVNEAL